MPVESVPMSPASPQVAREPIRAAQYDDDASDEDSPGDITTPSKRSLVGKPTAARSTHRRLASDSPLLGSPRPRRTPPTAAEAKAAEDEEEEEASGSPSWRARTRALRDRNVGVLLIACSQVWFALMAACVALMTQTDDASVPTWELIFSRMGITGICCHITLRVQRDPNPFLGPPGIRRLLVARGAVGFWGLFGLYFSLRYLPLSDAVSITFLAPILAGLLAAVWLGEPYRPIEFLAGIVSLGGVLLIAKPVFLFGDRSAAPILIDGREVTERERVFAVCVALGGCCGAAGAYNILRRIGKRASPVTSIQYFSVISVLISLVGPIVFPRDQLVTLPRNPLFILLLLFVGIAGFTGQALLTAGLAREKAGRGSLATYLQLPFAIGFERLLFHRVPDPISLLGASIIIASAITVLLTKPQADIPNRPRAQSASLGHGEAVPEILDDEDASDDDLECGPRRISFEADITEVASKRSASP